MKSPIPILFGEFTYNWCFDNAELLALNIALIFERIIYTCGRQARQQEFQDLLLQGHNVEYHTECWAWHALLSTQISRSAHVNQKAQYRVSDSVPSVFHLMSDSEAKVMTS